MLKTTILITLVGMTAIPSACARKRPVERIKDVEGNRLAKATFADGRNWLGRVTIVNNGSNNGFGFVGAQSETTLGHFRFTKDMLQYVAVDDVVNAKSQELKVLNEWPVTHSDYHQKVSGGRVSNTETENDQIGWEEKKYFHPNFSAPGVSQLASFPFEIDSQCWMQKSSQLVNNALDVAVDHINFTIEINYEINPACITDESYTRNANTHKVQYMYSFMPDRESSYKSYVYTGENDPLLRKYGYFNSTATYLNERNQTANSFLMNRWELGKTHTFYFTSNTPAAFKWIYTDPNKGVMARTNKLFADAGIDLRFEIKDAGPEHVFGDIRYSFINIVEDIDEQAPLGYGPSTAHPRTGEIISANSTLWSSSLKYYLQMIKDQVVWEQDRDKNSSIYREINKTLESPSAEWDKTSAFLADPKQADIFRFLLPDFTYSNQGSGFAQQQKPVAGKSSIERLMAIQGEGLKAHPEMLANLNAQVERSRNFESKRLKAEKKIVQSSTVTYLNEAMFSGVEAALNLSTPEEIVNDVMYRTAIHEFGHNLNLRHNFYGSVDAASRAKVPGAVKRASTSVMDYLSLKDEIGSDHDWEEYDRAALLYAYSNGKIDKIKESGDTLLYCTDEHVWTNPLCNRFDRGATPTEVMKSIIDSYDQTYWRSNFRYGRDFWAPNGYWVNAYVTMIEVKKFMVFNETAFGAGAIRKNLALKKDLDPAAGTNFSTAMREDMLQAAKMGIAFYASIIKQSNNDRPFTNAYDASSGSLTRLGIMDDKMFAMEFLMGDHSFPLDPNQGARVISFMEHLKDEAGLGPILKKLMGDIYVNAGDMYAGYDKFGRTYFMLTSSDMLDRAKAPTEYARISCFTKAGLESAFALKVADLALKPDAYVAKAATKDHANSDPYFLGESSIQVAEIDGRYYVAGTTKNPYAAELMKTYMPADSILHSFRSFHILTEGRVPECR